MPGKLNHGFNMIARDLDRAFSMGCFACYEVFLIQRIREESWTSAVMKRRKGEPLPESIPCRPNISELARLSEFSRPHLSASLSKLIAYRVLNVNASGLILINKDYRQWLKIDDKTRLATPRFTPEQVKYIVRAVNPVSVFDSVELANVDDYLVREDVQSKSVNCTSSRTKTVLEDVQYAVSEDVQCESASCTSSSTPTVRLRLQSHIVNHARVLEFNSEIKKTIIVAGEHAHADARTREEKSPPIQADPPPAAKSTASAIPRKPDPQVVADMIAFTKAAIGERAEIEFYDGKIEGWLFMYTPEELTKAIYVTQANLATIDPGRLAVYTAKILRTGVDTDGPKSKQSSDTSGKMLYDKPLPSVGKDLSPEDLKLEELRRNKNRELNAAKNAEIDERNRRMKESRSTNK